MALLHGEHSRGLVVRGGKGDRGRKAGDRSHPGLLPAWILFTACESGSCSLVGSLPASVVSVRTVFSKSLP